MFQAHAQNAPEAPCADSGAPFGSGPEEAHAADTSRQERQAQFTHADPQAEATQPLAAALWFHGPVVRLRESLRSMEPLSCYDSHPAGTLLLT